MDLFSPATAIASAAQYQLIFDQFVGRLRVGAMSTSLPPGHTVDERSPMSVTLKHDFGNDGSMRSIIVQGSPFVSYEYTNARPTIASAQILRRFKVNGVQAECGSKPLTASVFEFSLLQFDETWRLGRFFKF